MDNSTRPELLAAWRQWKGAVDCEYTGRAWLANELRNLTDKVASRFSRAGLQEGDNAALLLSNTVAFPVLLMALLRIGCNPYLMHAASREEERKRVLAEFFVPWVVHDFIEGVSRLWKSRFREVSTHAIGNVSVSLLSVPETGGKQPHSRETLSGAILHPTSGTYGLPSFCLRNQVVAVAEGRNLIETVAPYAQARVTVTTPLSHAFAYGFGMVSSLLTDSTLVLDTEFNPKRLLRKEMQQRSDILAMVPPMAQSLEFLAGKDASRKMARHVFYAGAPCNPTLAARFEETFNTNLYAIYGTTETGAVTTSYTDAGKRPGVGTPLKNVEITLRHCEQYKELGNQAGEICVRSSSQMQGYMQELPRSGAEAPWPTGDIGFLDQAGNLTLVSRTKEIINVHGLKVDASEVERVLLQHPHITDAAVYPGLRADQTEFVQAAVSGNREDMDPEALRRHCHRLLSPHKVPVLFHPVEKIPRTPSGKCLKIRCPGFPEHLVVA